MRGKEGIRPAIMIDSAAVASTTATMAKHTAQTHSNPAIQHDKRPAAAVLKVRKPTFQRPIHVRDDDRQAIAIIPPGFLADGVLQFPETLSPRPSLALFEVISQKIKTSRLHCIDDPSLLRMQRQSGFRRPVLHHFQRSARFGFAATQNDEVSRPEEFHPEPLAEPYVNVSAHTAPTMEPRRTPICQWANSFGVRREIRAIQWAARRL
jgi:hypothetical protein